MDKPNIVVTYNASTEQKALLLEMLGSEASLTFLNELAPAQREQSLEHATVLLSWNFPREILPQDYPHLQQVSFIQLLSAGADHMPFAERSLPRFPPLPALTARAAAGYSSILGTCGLLPE